MEQSKVETANLRPQDDAPALGVGILDVLDRHARRDPEHVALIVPRAEPVSYAGLHEQTSAMVARLRELDVRPQDRVLLCPGGGVDGTVLMLALIEAAVCCPLNAALARPEYESILDALRPTVAILADHDPSAFAAAVHARGLRVLRWHADESGGRLGAERGPAVALPGAEDEPPGMRPSLLLRTSGTALADKIVPLSQPTIIAAASATVRAYRLGPADRRLNAMPVHHIQGLVGSVIAALVGGGSVVCLPAFDAKDTFGQIERYRPTWFSASPTMHRLLVDLALERPEVLGCLRFARVGSAALPAPLRARLEAAYQVPIIESYGMSEAHQIASTPLPPDRPVRGMMPTGSTVGMRAPDGSVSCEPGASGEIVIRGANVIDRYLAPIEANAAFVDGWFRTGDLGSLAEDGSVLIHGRVKEMINRGGEKISPYEIENVLLAHPDISNAVAFGVPDELLTEKVGAAVVLRAGARVEETALRRFAAARLAPFKVPVRVLVEDELPVGSGGKLVRSEFSRRLGGRFADPAEPDRGGEPGSVVAEPRTTLMAALCGMWAFALRRPRVGVDEDFFALGGDSLAAVSLLLAIQELLNVVITPSELFDEVNTVARMAGRIEQMRAVLAENEEV